MNRITLVKFQHEASAIDAASAIAAACTAGRINAHGVRPLPVAAFNVTLNFMDLYATHPA
jgi:hypothetical protein|tara:strand:+ start:1602 stop:1781 length:180 start_codon:yes stop_codon:yes gene_type:complete